MPRLVSKLLFILLISLPLYTWALPSDREQPIEIEADHAQLDDEQGITQYKGKAILTQGTLRIEGDIITFYYDDNKQLTKAVAQGKRASYEQIQKAGEAPIRAKAYAMEYHAQAQKIYLIGKGQSGKMVASLVVSVLNTILIEILLMRQAEQITLNKLKKVSVYISLFNHLGVRKNHPLLS